MLKHSRDVRAVLGERQRGVFYTLVALLLTALPAMACERRRPGAGQVDRAARITATATATAAADGGEQEENQGLCAERVSCRAPWHGRCAGVNG